MIYLAIVERRNKQFQSGSGRLQTLALRGDNGLWIAQRKAIALPSEKDRFHEGVLVLVELGFKDAIASIAPAADEVIRALVAFSDDIFKQREDVDLWNHALKYQYVELRKRQQELDRREDMLKLQEGTINEVHKIIREKLEREEVQKQLS